MSATRVDPRVGQIERLFDHLAWADAELARAVRAAGAPANAIREYAHMAGAEEVWLSRIERRPSTVAVWPELDATQAAELARRTATGFKQLIHTLGDFALDAAVSYTNTAGKTFATPLGDILIHVAMHGQYHRGKVNQMLREAGANPAPVDFIGFVRGVPAATGGPAK